MLKDKDLLKNTAYTDYSKRVVALSTLPAVLQVAHIYLLNRPQFLMQCSYVRQLKVMAAIGSFGLCWYERTQLQRKWRYYDQLYPEPTQLQKTLVTEAQVYQIREEKGLKEQTLEEKQAMDVETARTYQQMYMLAPQRTPEPE